MVLLVLFIFFYSKSNVILALITSSHVLCWRYTWNSTLGSWSLLVLIVSIKSKINGSHYLAIFIFILFKVWLLTCVTYLIRALTIHKPCPFVLETMCLSFLYPLSMGCWSLSRVCTSPIVLLLWENLLLVPFRTGWIEAYSNSWLVLRETHLGRVSIAVLLSCQWLPPDNSTHYCSFSVEIVIWLMSSLWRVQSLCQLTVNDSTIALNSATVYHMDFLCVWVGIVYSTFIARIACVEIRARKT